MLKEAGSIAGNASLSPTTMAVHAPQQYRSCPAPTVSQLWCEQQVQSVTNPVNSLAASRVDQLWRRRLVAAPQMHVR